ncbi:MAG: hypothetical protein Ct9H300mP6_15190 [Gammaproteobacteria bacterium]|nr:MAG: hypothetical protein Ct9H300mP6_15190 [Gammaproteobacteria bacterium]
MATDDLRIEQWLKNESGIEIECEFRPDLFNEIRLGLKIERNRNFKTGALINERSLLSAIISCLKELVGMK